MDTGAPKIKVKDVEKGGGEASNICCGAEDSSGDVISLLLCMKCRQPICRSEDILEHRATDVWAAQVYAYELDLFAGTPPLWCYSATNPSSRRFDLVRCSSATVTRDHTLRIHGEWSREHSFFLDHEWCFTECNFCGYFLGWGFRQVLDEKPDDNEDSETDQRLGFIGLILTHCVGMDGVKRAEYERIIGIDTQQHDRGEASIATTDSSFTAEPDALEEDQDESLIFELPSTSTTEDLGTVIRCFLGSAAGVECFVLRHRSVVMIGGTDSENESSDEYE